VGAALETEPTEIPSRVIFALASAEMPCALLSIAGTCATTAEVQSHPWLTLPSDNSGTHYGWIDKSSYVTGARLRVLTISRHATASTPNRTATAACAPEGGSTLNIRAAAGM
jgi:hypothetical protein